MENIYHHRNDQPDPFRFPVGLDVLRDLGIRDLLPLASGERLWRLYIFRPTTGQATHLEHRIYVTRKADGRLALVTFAIHTPVEGRAVRSGIARVPDLGVRDLDRIIEAIRRQVQAVECEEVDLSMANGGK